MNYKELCVRLAYPLIGVLVLIFLINYYFPFSSVNDFVPGLEEDAIKNFYTIEYYLKYDDGNVFSGMHYPFQNHLVFTDSQPAIAWILKGLKELGLPVEGHAVGVVNFLMLFSFVITFLLLYWICLHYKLPKWIGLIVAFSFALMNPQMDRILMGHYALAYSWSIPLTWFLLLKYQKEGKENLYLALLGGFHLTLSFIHPYLALISTFFAVGYVFLTLLKTKEKKYIIHLLLMIMPVLVYMVWLKSTDFVEGRPPSQYGFFEYRATLSSVIFSENSFFTSPISNIIEYKPSNNEGNSYLGIVPVFIAIFCVFQWAREKVRTNNYLIKREWPSKDSLLFVSAFFVLLFSMAIPFKWGLHDLVNFLGPIRQFRSIGRFAWVFYYVGGVLLIVYAYRHYGRKLKWVYVLSVICMLDAVWFFHSEFSEVKTHLSTNPFSDMEMNKFLEENELDESNYQAVLGFPFTLIGNEELAITTGAQEMRDFMAVSQATGLPIMNVMAARNSIDYTRETYDYIVSVGEKGDVIKDKLLEKPLLLIIASDSLSDYANKWKDRGSKVGEFRELIFYRVSVE